MERFSGYLYNDVKSKEKELRTSLVRFLQQTCRLNGFEVDFKDKPFELSDGVLMKLKWSLELNTLYAIGVENDTKKEVAIPLASSELSVSNDLTIGVLLLLVEHLKEVLS